MPESSNLSKRKEALIRGLARKSLRSERGRFVADGLRVVEEALAGRMRVTDLVGTPSTASDIALWEAAGRLRGVEVSMTDERTFRTLVDSVHPQGVLAIVEEPRGGLAEIDDSGPVLLLDRVQDPGNAGTLLRTLHATGGRSVIALTGTVDLFNAKAVRASAGSLFHLHLASRVPRGAALGWIADRGLPLLALETRGRSLFDAVPAPPERFVLAVGNEPGGLAEEIIERSQTVFALPMRPGVDSLNAAVAGSVALYELFRRSPSSGSGAEAV